MKGHTSNQLHTETPTTKCMSMQIIAGNHENVHTATQYCKGMDIKRRGIDSNGMDIFVFS